VRRVLCSLQRLTQLELPYATVPEDAANPSSPSQRLPTFAKAAPPRTFQLDFIMGQIEPVIHLMARCTRLPHPVRTWLPNTWGLGYMGYLAVKGWCPNWLLSLFTALKRFWNAVVLVDDADVDCYLAALAASAPIRASCWDQHPTLRFRGYRVCLGEAVTPAGLGRLLSSTQLPDNTLVICRPPDEWEAQGPPPHVLSWTAGLALTSQLLARVPVQADRASALRVLHLHGCEPLGDGGVAALAALAPGLQEVHLRNARQVGDAGLAALAKGCQSLSSVVLSGAVRVTAAGVVRLMALERVDEVALAGLGLGRAAALHRDVLQLLSARGPGDMLQHQWVVELGRDRDTQKVEVVHALRVFEIA
jgi:hypothetical protein